VQPGDICRVVIRAPAQVRIGAILQQDFDHLRRALVHGERQRRPVEGAAREALVGISAELENGADAAEMWIFSWRCYRTILTISLSHYLTSCYLAICLPSRYRAISSDYL
jgi:hypothetical protein